MKKLLTLFFILFLCSTWSFAQDCTLGTAVGDACTLDAPGMVTVPAGVTMIKVKAWGAGGGSDGANNKRPGGGGGAYFCLSFPVVAGDIVDVTQVGQGIPNADGEPTTLTAPNGAPISVNGGGAPTAANSPGVGGAGAGGPFTPGGDGGKRAEPGGAGGGGGGSGPGATGGGNGNVNVGGIAGLPGGGAGGDLNNPGTAATGPGGGAGGSGNGSGSGTADLPGGNGQVVVCVEAIEILPVELISFNANARDNQTLLEWQTASEENNRGFEIQKSKDGIAWDILEFVEGKGITSVLNTYTATDKSPSQGSNYYRLKQLDFDGKFEYSKTVIADFNRLDEVAIFPNPTKNQLTLINGAGEAIIYNALGQAVKHLTIDANQATIQLADLLNGQYYLQMLKEDGTIVTKQFAKVN